MKVDYRGLGRTVAKRRIELGMTQEQLAEFCGLSASYIGCIERANRKASLDTLIELCFALNVSPNHLLSDSLPDDFFFEYLDTPLKLREPDYTLRNTLSNWFLAELPDESMQSDVPVSSVQLSQLQFTLLGEELPSTTPMFTRS